MVDPATRQRVGISDIPEVILEQIDGFSDKWVKGSKDLKEKALNHRLNFGLASTQSIKKKNENLLI